MMHLSFPPGLKPARCFVSLILTATSPMQGLELRSHNEDLRRANERIAAQLDSALTLHLAPLPALDLDTPADRTLALLRQLMKGNQPSLAELAALHNVVATAGGCMALY